MSEAYEGPCDALDDDNREAVKEVEEKEDEKEEEGREEGEEGREEGEEGRKEGEMQDVLDMGELGDLGKPWVDAVYPQGGNCKV